MTLVPLVKIKDRDMAIAWVKEGGWTPEEFRKETGIRVQELVGYWAECEHAGSGANWSKLEVPQSPPSGTKKEDILTFEVVENRFYDDWVPAVVSGDQAWVEEEELH